jgi:hypothetical protein
MNAPRTGWNRGTKPSSPGNLTARIFNENQRRTEAQKRAQDAGDPYTSGFTAGWNRGYDQGWDAGYEAVVKQLKEAGLDVASVLDLNGDEDEDEDAE